MTDFNPELDLYIERHIKAKPETVWRCWTDPKLFAEWFAPKPVKITDIEYEFRPGGKANLTMTLPDGTVMPLEGCVLEVEPARRLVTTDALGSGYRPRGEPFLTAIIEFEPKDGGTLYKATALHSSEEIRKRHEEMGFQDGWGTTLRQLDELATSLT
ncbi:SRPBCC family protein [Silicimonas algicola]|uniref:Uncharacterized protein YndB with AHSA1/START domain n=1 Tax=Silicimonas algicola TaxID=1826607 RepID=A0A316G712_9RHOB|nr:SRPBCC family protein [Silicimonas algicola]PWK56412.1 uncharacterized protein YndB with AHSA1/START domain [Silicimonas algicola]